MEANRWYYDLVENLRIKFEQDPFHAKLGLVERFQVWHEVMFEDNESILRRPAATRTTKTHMKTLLKMVFDAMGHDVLVLCALATTRTKFGKVKAEGLIPQLQNWWNHVAHPEALGDVVAELKIAFPHTLAMLQRKTPSTYQTGQLSPVSTLPISNEKRCKPKSSTNSLLKTDLAISSPGSIFERFCSAVPYST